MDEPKEPTRWPLVERPTAPMGVPSFRKEIRAVSLGQEKFDELMLAMPPVCRWVFTGEDFPAEHYAVCRTSVGTGDRTEVFVVVTP